MVSLVAQTVKNRPVIYESGVWSLGGKILRRRKWQPTPTLLPRKFHGRRSLVQATVHGVAKSRTRLSDFTYFHSLTSKVMLKILQARLQQYMNHELPDIQAGFRKGRGTRDQIANICWIIKKAREFQKNIYFCFIDYAKADRKSTRLNSSHIL